MAFVRRPLSSVLLSVAEQREQRRPVPVIENLGPMPIPGLGRHVIAYPRERVDRRRSVGAVPHDQAKRLRERR